MYQLAMAQAYFDQGGQRTPAAFDYFFRKLPFEGGYVVFCGLWELLPALENLHFSEAEIDWLRRQDRFSEEFLAWLASFRFSGNIYSVPEGELVFPHAPVLRVEGNLIETQLIETLLLNLLNFQSLVATKAARMRYAAGGRQLSEFGLRRAQAQGGLHASRASVVGGFDSTSNVLAAALYDLPAAGTMAHSFVQSQENELEAFRRFAEAQPRHCTLLVDTYDTLESGVPNAIRVGLEMEEKGFRLQAIRLDSGDLAYLAKKARKMLDEAGLSYVRIVASNQLDEYVIRSLILQQAPIDIFGVGTALSAARPDAALDGVYKLCMAGGKPRLKLSENIGKLTLPGLKQVYRYLDEKDCYVADAVALEGEDIPLKMIHPFEPEKSMMLDPSRAIPLLQPFMKEGRRTGNAPSLGQIAAHAKQSLQKLPEEHKRFDYPHVYKVGLSEKLLNLRNSLRDAYKH